MPCPVLHLPRGQTALYGYRDADDAGDTFTLRLIAVMLAMEARGTDESNSPKRVSGAGHGIRGSGNYSPERPAEQVMGRAVVIFRLPLAGVLKRP